MKRKLLMIILTVFLFSCAIKSINDYKVLCRHTAIICAVTYTDFTKLPSRIVVGNQIINGRVFHTKWHAQAQGKIKNDEWKYLSFINNKVVFNKQDNFVPKYYIDSIEYIKMLYKEK